MKKFTIFAFIIMGLCFQVQNQVPCTDESNTNNILIDALYLDGSDDLPFPIGLV